MAGPLGALGRALSYRDARVFFAASLTSWCGLWMHRIAVSWLAWELTRSAVWVGLVAFSDLFPAVIASPLAGAVADRVDRVHLTMAAQSVIGLAALTNATLTATGHMTVHVLLTLELISGTGASFAQPAWQCLLPGLVPREDLPAAIACNSLCFNVARFVGPACAGPLIATWGVVPPIALNALAAFVATATLPRLRIAAAARRGHPAAGGLWSEAAAGLRYAARHPGLGPLLAFAAVLAVLLRGVQEILPPFVERAFGRGAESLAVLTGAIGVGALLAGLWVAGRGRVAGTTRLVVLAAMVQAAAIAGFAATGWFPFGVLCAAVFGAAASTHGIAVQTLAQTACDPAMRGRILSLWGLITRACPAVGAVVLGALGERFGLRWPTLGFVALSVVWLGWGMTRLPRAATVLEAPRGGG